MIGWRPYVLTLLALLLVAVVVLDVSASVKRSPPPTCATADALFKANVFDEARKAYISVLKLDPKSDCATKALMNTSSTVK